MSALLTICLLLLQPSLPPLSPTIPDLVIKGTLSILFTAVSGALNRLGCGVDQETWGNE